MIAEQPCVRAEIREPLYCGLRLTADQYDSLPEDGFRYELVDGVVIMSPGASFPHQRISLQIAASILEYLQRNPVGEVFENVDVYLGLGPHGADLVYRPDIIFLRTDQVTRRMTRFQGPPPLVVEIVSESSKRYDRETKMADYERCGVTEFWLIDPDRKGAWFYQGVGGRFREIAVEGDTFRSLVLPGFELSLKQLRALFEE